MLNIKLYNLQHFKDANLPIPEFRNISEGFQVTIYDKQNSNVVENVVENRLDKILNIIKQNNKISANQIAKLFNITERTAQRDLDKLKKQNKIKRIGSYKGGHWEIIK